MQERYDSVHSEWERMCDMMYPIIAPSLNKKYIQHPINEFMEITTSLYKEDFANFYFVE